MASRSLYSGALTEIRTTEVSPCFRASAQSPDKNSDFGKQDASGFNPPERYCISRQSPTRYGSACWRVVLVRDGRVVTSRNFSDRKYGSAALALEIAKRYRDAMLTRFPLTPCVVINQRLKAHNTSGYPGVGIRRMKGSLYFCAQTRLPTGVALCRYFSVSQYGEARARDLAIAERLRQLERVDGVYLRSPAARSLLPQHAPPPSSQDLVPRRKPEGPTRLAPKPDQNAYRKAGEALMRRLGWKPGMSPRPAILHHIRRYQNPITNTWGWRIDIRRKDYYACRIFMDSAHGGTEASFEKARACRDGLLLKLGSVLTESVRFGKGRNSR